MTTITINTEEIKSQAKKELEEEYFKQEVEKYKEKLRQKRSFWDIIFPYKIIILKKEKVR